VVVDSQLRTPPRARILADDSSTLIVCAHADPARRDALLEAGALILELPGADGRVDLPALMKELGSRGLNEIHVEAGATLNGTLLDAGLVDEWLAYFAPLVMGHHARGLFDFPALTAMAKSRQFQLINTHMLGQDLRLTLRPA
jgi:diaminohydroxyphosphoribosylaminopyrimidine deaminase/5-amino-6-(5-phosphoribosylamino)uracil reductase